VRVALAARKTNAVQPLIRSTCGGNTEEIMVWKVR
jgi:hypothetical protein